MRGSKLDSEPPLWVTAIMLADRWHVTPWDIWDNMTAEWYHRISSYERVRSEVLERKHGKKPA